MTNDEILAKLAEMDASLTPANFAEFEIGMFLISLLDMVEFMDEDFDPDEFDVVIDGAKAALVIWKKKYQEYVDIVVGKKNAN